MPIPQHLVRFDATGLEPGPDTVAAWLWWDHQREQWMCANGYVLFLGGQTVPDWAQFCADVRKQEATT